MSEVKLFPKVKVSWSGIKFAFKAIGFIIGMLSVTIPAVVGWLLSVYAVSIGSGWAIPIIIVLCLWWYYLMIQWAWVNKLENKPMKVYPDIRKWRWRLVTAYVSASLLMCLSIILACFLFLGILLSAVEGVYWVCGVFVIGGIYMIYTGAQLKAKYNGWFSEKLKSNCVKCGKYKDITDENNKCFNCNYPHFGYNYTKRKPELERKMIDKSGSPLRKKEVLKNESSKTDGI